METFAPVTPGRPFDPLTAYRLPGRMHAEQAARLLGFQAHDIPVLVAAKLLEPLGRPVPNATKYFAAVTLEALRADHAWLNAASKAISKHWRIKNASKTNPVPAPEAPSL